MFLKKNCFNFYSLNLIIIRYPIKPPYFFITLSSVSTHVQDTLSKRRSQEKWHLFLKFSWNIFFVQIMSEL